MNEKKLSSAFIIRTPYHYINALEAANKYGVNLKRSLLVVWSNHFRERFSQLTEDENWGRIEYLPVVHHKEESSLLEQAKNIAEDTIYLGKANLLSWRNGKIENCFSIVPVEKYVKHIVNRIGTERLILIDEGVGIFSLMERYIKAKKKRIEYISTIET